MDLDPQEAMFRMGADMVAESTVLGHRLTESTRNHMALMFHLSLAEVEVQVGVKERTATTNQEVNLLTKQERCSQSRI